MSGGHVSTTVVHLSVIMVGCELAVAIRSETSLGTSLILPMAPSASSNNGVATGMEALLHTAMDRNSLLP